MINYAFWEGLATVTWQDCQGLHPTAQYRLEPSGDEQVFASVGNPAEDLIYLGASVDEVRLHADDECELRLVVTTGPVSQELSLHRGEVCVVDWCDDLDPASDKILVDYCEGEPGLQCEGR